MCLFLLCTGIILSIIGNYTNTRFFAIWAITTSKPWPTMSLRDSYIAGFYVQFFQWSCWVTGSLCLVLMCFLVYLVLLYSKLIFSKEPWVWSSWNPVRKNANEWIRTQPSIKNKTGKEQWDMLTSEQQINLLRYHQEEMFTAKKSLP